MKIEQIAMVCHEANAAYCRAIGDDSQLSWADAPDWQRTSALKGVQLHVDDPDAGAEASHQSWCHEKWTTGWNYGKVKDEVAMTHPCLVPFGDLPIEQQLKDILFRSVVIALSD